MWKTINSEFWTDPEWEEVDYKLRYIFLYLITSPYTNIAGVSKISLKRIAFETGLPPSEVKKILSKLIEMRKIMMVDEQIWVINYLKYQPTNGPRYSKGVANAIQSTPFVKLFLEKYPKYKEFINVNLDELPDIPEPKQEPEETNEPQQRTPYKEIVDLYHQICKSLPRVQTLNDFRKSLIKARWKEHPELEYWKDYFQRVEASDFLTGRVKSYKSSPFVANLEWIMRPRNFANIIEGKYDNRKSKVYDEFSERLHRLKGGK